MINKLADELKRLRAIKGVTLREVEKNTTGISNAYLSQLERGDAANPSPQKLYELAKYYKIPYELLLQWAGHVIPDTDVKKLTTVEALLKSSNLTEEEQSDVAEYIEFIRSKRRKKER